MKIFVSTSDGHDLAIKPFSYLFNKFWSPTQEVTVLGYRQPLFESPSNFNFVSMAPKQETIKQWSTDLRNFFKTVKDEYFVYSVEDNLIVRPVDFEILEELKTYLKDDKVGRIGFTSDVGAHKGIEELKIEDGYKIIERKQDSNCRVSAMWSLWKKEYILKWLVPNREPWESETEGCEEARKDGYRVIGSSGRNVIQCACSTRKGKLDIPLDFRLINNEKESLSEDIINDMKEKNIISEKGTLI